MTEAKVRVADGYILAWGSLTADPPVLIEIVTLTPEQEAVVLSDAPGQRILHEDGTVTIDPTLHQRQEFDAAEYAERLRLVNERALEDPAFAALADLTLRSREH